MCSPAFAERISHSQDLYSQLLIQTDGRGVQWKGWFAHNALPMPTSAFDRSWISISAAVDGLGVILESYLLAARELAQGGAAANQKLYSLSKIVCFENLLHPPWKRL